MEKYESVPHHPLTSRIIRDITFNLNTAKYEMPSLCDSLNEYIVENREFVLGDTVQKVRAKNNHFLLFYLLFFFVKVLYCFYNLNYQPKNEKIFQYATDIINRSINYIGFRIYLAHS